MNNNKVEVSIVMPCLNEELTIGRCILEVQEFFKRTDISYEIIIGDNNSTDKSKEIAIQHGTTVVDVKEKGYGITLKKATEAANGKYVIMGDSDLSYDFSNLMPFIDKLREGNQLVMGNRFRGGIEKGAMPWKNKYIGNPILSKIGKIFFGIKINDFHCGLRGFSKESFDQWNLQSNGMEYASEIVIKASLKNNKICEVPTKLRKDGRKGQAPHLRPWRDGFRHLSFMLLHSPRWLFFYPGVISFFVFAIIFGILFFKPIEIGSVKFDTNTLITFSFLTFFSIQLILFGIISEIIAFKLFSHTPRTYFVKKLSNFNLKLALKLSVISIFIGIILFISCIYQWHLTGYGDLLTSSVFRLLVVSLTLLMIGFQIIFNCFFIIFLSFGRLSKKN